MKKIKVKKVGENIGYYREYFQNVDTKKFYAKMTFGIYEDWFTCSCNGGEPDMPISRDIIFKEVTS